jgi:hypothetical protein
MVFKRSITMESSLELSLSPSAFATASIWAFCWCTDREPTQYCLASSPKTSHENGLQWHY